MRKYTFIVFMLACLPIFGMAQSALSVRTMGYDAQCNGSTNGSAKVTASGGVAPYSYIWAPIADTTDSISGLIAGIYSVTVTDSSGHTISGTVTINQPTPLAVSIDSIVVFPCFRTTGGSICGCGNTLWAIVSGGTPPYSYLWTPGGGTDDTLKYACYVLFTVKVTDSNNCISSDSLQVVVPTLAGAVTNGVAQVNNADGIHTYPNPANNQLNISTGQSATGITNLAVYDMAGTQVYEQQTTGKERLITIDVSGLVEGEYLLKIAGGASQETTHFSIVR